MVHRKLSDGSNASGSDQEKRDISPIVTDLWTHVRVELCGHTHTASLVTAAARYLALILVICKSTQEVGITPLEAILSLNYVWFSTQNRENLRIHCSQVDLLPVSFSSVISV